MELLPPLRSNMYKNMNIFDRTGGIVDASDDSLLMVSHCVITSSCQN